MRQGQSRKFQRHFDTYVCVGDAIRAELPGGFTAVAWIERDEHAGRPDERDDGFWPSRDPKAAGYVGNVSPRTFQRHHATAEKVMRAWENDEWFYCGVCVSIQKDGVWLTDKYAYALWGVDCNYPAPTRWRRNGYLRTVANELLSEALDAAKAKLAKLMDGKLIPPSKSEE